MTALLHSQIAPRFSCRTFRIETQRQKAVAPVSVNSAVPTENKCKKLSHAPTSTIAYAFHNFEQPDSQLGVEQPKECCTYISIFHSICVVSWQKANV